MPKLTSEPQSNLPPWALGSTQELQAAQGARDAPALGMFTLSPITAIPPSAGLGCAQWEGDDKTSALWLLVLQAFSLWLKPQEAQSCDPEGRAAPAAGSHNPPGNGSLLFSAPSPATACGFQLHGAQDFSWVVQGVKESKGFHSFSLCFAWLSCRE